MSADTENVESETIGHVAGFQVLTTVVMRSSLFWGVTQRNPLKVALRFGGTYRLHLQGRRIIRHESSAFHLLSREFLAMQILLS